MHKACTVTALHLLDVHHTRPISEGERRTALDEVQILCKNHHAQAHHELRQAIFLQAQTAETPLASSA